MVTLDQANLSHLAQIHKMQVAAFRQLLIRYRDTETNPGAEPPEKIRRRMEQENSAYYFIVLNKDTRIGAIRVANPTPDICRIAPMFILPEFQGNGYAQQAILLAEARYPFAVTWELDTIKQENSLCHLYEKMGYRPTGREEEIKKGMTIVYYQKDRS